MRDMVEGSLPSSAGAPRGEPMIICLTGKMAAGKNHVCAMLEKEGCLSLDLDRAAHAASELCSARILGAFGAEAQKRGLSLTGEDGSLDRRALGQIVFSDSGLLARLEGIIYPKITELADAFIEENKGRTLILNATVLFKIPGLLAKCDKILFVRAGFLKRLVRARKRDRLPLRQILARFRNQRNLLGEYREFADRHGIPMEIIRN